ncbi:MAG TPA: class I adenylate-forming enzyme family protein [Verrucomicrobiae bacterium]|nr:class I adenylate-forming enzyme family protein [Verrucomicrobiae bacterium]
MNLTELLDAAVECWPQKPALIEDSTIISYAALAEKINFWAEKLKRFGLVPESRVGLCFPNCIDYVALTFALWKINVIVVPVPVECPLEEWSEIAETMELSAILSQKSLGQSEPLQPNCFLTCLNRATLPDNHGLNIAFIRFTSGTTSARKGVVLCHETVRARVFAANKAFRISENDTVIWCLPMAHHFLITIVLYLSRGATIVLTRHILARAFLETVNRHRGTFLYAAPFHYALLACDNSDLNLDSARMAVSTTCALPKEVAANFLKRFGKPLVSGLGIIELGLVSLNTDDPRHRCNSVGRAIEDFRVKIISPDAEGVGEIAVSGPGIFDAYTAPWIPREKLLPDGWFATGDIGWLDAEGFLFLAGRKTAVINLAGRKVFPEEIEAVLNRHPAVAESRVFGRAHPHLGEVVEAEIVLSAVANGFEDLPAFCREHLAAFKIPSRFHVVDALPRTAVTGKIRRNLAAV